MLDKLGAGSIVVVSAVSATTGKVDEIRLQVVTTRQLAGFEQKKTVLSIVSGGSCLYSTLGDKYGDVPSGTYCLGGTANRFLPEPEYRMVGFGGPRIDTDYSLMLVAGERVAIIRNISNLCVEPCLTSPPQPEGLVEFCLGVEQTMLRISEDNTPEKLAATKREMIDLVRSNIIKAPDWLTEELSGCCLDGIESIGSFLIFADRQGKLNKALKLVKEGFKGQWFYNHPQVRADPAFGSNRAFIAGLYHRAGASVLREDVDPEPNADGTIAVPDSVASKAYRAPEN